VKSGQEATGIVLAVALSVFASTAAATQDKATKHSLENSTAQETSAPKPLKKPTLVELTRVSTDEAVQEAKKKAEGKSAEGTSPAESPESAVTEFRPATPNVNPASGTVVAPAKGTKKSALKNFHGTAYGSLDPKSSKNHTTGGAVGMDSKEEKTHVYVETERRRTNVPPPH
jgi:hypothetical protein